MLGGLRPPPLLMRGCVRVCLLCVHLRACVCIEGTVRGKIMMRLGEMAVWCGSKFGAFVVLNGGSSPLSSAEREGASCQGGEARIKTRPQTSVSICCPQSSFMLFSGCRLVQSGRRTDRRERQAEDRLARTQEAGGMASGRGRKTDTYRGRGQEMGRMRSGEKGS